MLDLRSSFPFTLRSAWPNCAHEHRETRLSGGTTNGLRLDRWLKKYYPSLAAYAGQKLVRTGQVRVDGGRMKAGHAAVHGPRKSRVPRISGPQHPAPRAVA